jgi:hypothetical protein
MKIKIGNLSSSAYLIVSLIFMLAFTTNIVAKNKTNDNGNSAKSSSNYGKRYSNNILRGVRLSDVFVYNETDTTPFRPQQHPFKFHL